MLEASLGELEAELAAASNFRSVTSATLESASDHAEGISQFLDAFEMSVSSLERLSLSGLVGARESAGSLGRCEEALGRERAQVTEAGAELERRGAEIQAMRMQLQVLEGRLRDAFETLDEERGKGEGAVAYLSESLRSQGDAMMDKEEQVLSLEAKLKDGEGAIGLLSASLIQVKEREGELSNQVQKLQDERSEINFHAEARARTLEQERDGFRDALFEAQNKLRDVDLGSDSKQKLLVERISELEETIGTAQEQVMSLRSESERLTALLEVAENGRREAERCSEIAQRKVRGLQGACDKLASAGAVIARMSKLPLLKSLRKWCHEAKKQGIAKRMLSRMQGLACWRSFGKWRFAVSSRKRVERAGMIVIGRWTHRAVLSAFALWAQRIRELMRVKSVAKRAVMRVTQGPLLPPSPISSNWELLTQILQSLGSYPIQNLDRSPRNLWPYALHLDAALFPALSQFPTPNPTKRRNKLLIFISKPVHP